MAMTLPPDGKVVACDITDKYLKDVNSQQYFKEVSRFFISCVLRFSDGILHAKTLFRSFHSQSEWGNNFLTCAKNVWSNQKVPVKIYQNFQSQLPAFDSELFQH